MAGFVQIMKFKTARIDEVESFAKRMQEDLGAKYLANKATVTADRDEPGTYWVIVEFDSYDVAMQNSNDPETDKYATELVTMLDGPPAFHNLDVRTVLTPR